jgi:hypothetical protein
VVEERPERVDVEERLEEMEVEVVKPGTFSTPKRVEAPEKQRMSTVIPEQTMEMESPLERRGSGAGMKRDRAGRFIGK